MVVTEVDTATAAHAVGLAASGFRTWARRRGLDPIRHERRGRSTVAVWDLDAVYAATATRAVTPLPPSVKPVSG